MRRAVALGLLLAACADPPPRSLMDLSKWTEVPAARDPFRTSTSTSCRPEGHGVEDFGGEPSYTVRTRECGFLTLEQPSQAGGACGELLHLRLWHFELIPPAEPAEARVVVRAGDIALLDLVVPLPAKSQLHAPYVELAQDLPAGTPLLFHLSNHGTNTWNLLELTAGAVPPTPP